MPGLGLAVKLSYLVRPVPAIGATTSNTTPTGWIEQSTEQGGRAEGAELTDRRAVDR
jgi:hypothetical protein